MIETLSDVWNQSVRLEMRCAHGKTQGMHRIPECQYGHVLEIETLIATRGRDMPLDLLRDRLRCPRCGSRKVRLLYGLSGNSGAARATA